MRNPILVTFIPMVDYPINEFITWWIILNFILIAQIKTIKSFYAYFMYNFYEIFILNVNHHLMLTFGLQVMARLTIFDFQGSLLDSQKW